MVNHALIMLFHSVVLLMKSKLAKQSFVTTQNFVTRLQMVQNASVVMTISTSMPMMKILSGTGLIVLIPGLLDVLRPTWIDGL